MIKKVLSTLLGCAITTSSVLCSENMNIDEPYSPSNTQGHILINNNGDDNSPQSPKRPKPETPPQQADINILQLPTELLEVLMRTTRIAEGIKFSLTCKQTSAVINSRPKIWEDYIQRFSRGVFHLKQDLPQAEKEEGTTYNQRVIPALREILISFTKIIFNIFPSIKLDDAYIDDDHFVSISGDGRTIVGTQVTELPNPNNHLSYRTPFALTRTNLMEWNKTSFDTSGDTDIDYIGRSPDYSGTYIIGIKRDLEDTDQAVFWKKGKKKAQVLELNSEALAITAEAVTTTQLSETVIVGRALNPNDQIDKFKAARWIIKGNEKKFGFLGTLNQGRSSEALANSLDAKTIVGESIDGQDNNKKAFIWTEAEGMRSLGALTKDLESRAISVSGKGDIVIGSSTNPQTRHSRPFIWRKLAQEILDKLKAKNLNISIHAGGLMQELLASQEFDYAHAEAISANGRRIVGYGKVGHGPEARDQAVLWALQEQGYKFYSLEQILKPKDIEILTARGISADGMSIVGTCTIPTSYDSKLFYAYIPDPYVFDTVHGIKLLKRQPSLPAQKARG